MTFILTSFTISLMAIGLYAILFLRMDGWRKWLGASTFGILCVVSGLLMTFALGYPKPSGLAGSLSNYKIVAIQYIPDTAIYLWGYNGSSKTPLAVALPWNLDRAKHVAQKQREAQGSGGTMMLNDPGSNDPITLVQAPTPVKENDN